METVTMSKTRIIGIIGAYGQTGKVVVDELFKTTDCILLVGGRNLEKAQELTAKYGDRVIPQYVDVFNPKILSEFCQNAGIVINCSGPAYSVLAQVALSALEHKCHYIDPATASEPYWTRLEPYKDEIKSQSLTFLISSGWVPGLSDLFPIYVDTYAEKYFDSIDSFEVYIADPSEWSRIGIQDIIHYTKKYGHEGLGIFKYGQWTPANVFNFSRVVTLPQPLKKQRAFVNFFPELKHFVKQKKYPEFGVYTAISPWAIMTLAYISIFMKTESDHAYHMMRAALKKDKQRNNPFGWEVVIVKGKKGDKKQQLIAKLTQDKHYWITGIVPAIATQMILSGQISAKGSFCLSEAVDPISFMKELAKAGVQYDITLDGVPC
ncbi:hypothetical protein CEN46_09420 [Fischerella thermalis CCMEE 5318]|uniref:Saccharopine dehydrogenase NADP binding domain-containing protein n=2 Tax=Fischerella TaxID=1190 RepID=A0A2N6LHZ1_9CYAN|nr:hypothetical protein CEN46_09420 [Fischerella thermalis CCMEE 5318]